MEPAAAVTVEIMAGKLSAQVHAHEIVSQQGVIPCWSYVTEGLAAHRQTEIVFTLRREPAEPAEQFPEDPLRLFATIYELAENGQRVTSGSFTEFGERKFFDHHLLYVRAQPMAGVTLPAACLVALLVTPDELRAVRAFGSTRVLARMGQASFYYPFPPWSERRRRGLALERTFEASLLSKMPRASAHDVHVGMKDKQIIVTALRSEQASWQARLAQIPETAPLALLTSFDPTANGCLTWVPGQKGPEAIIPPGSDGSRLCGCFIAFVGEQPASSGKLLEDGFAMQLTADAWRDVRRALVEGSQLEIPAGDDGMSFALTWRDEVYVSPIDAQAYTAEGGWETYAPSTAGPAGAPGKVKIGEVRLLTPQAEIAARTSVQGLAAFCREILRCAEAALGDRTEQLAILLRLRCKPQGHDVNLSGRGDVPSEVMATFFEAVKQLPHLPIREGEVAFEMTLTMAAEGASEPSPS